MTGTGTTQLILDHLQLVPRDGSGVFGLIRAAQTYSPDRGKFTTWAKKQIRWNRLDEKRSAGSVCRPAPRPRCGPGSFPASLAELENRMPPAPDVLDAVIDRDLCQHIRGLIGDERYGFLLDHADGKHRFDTNASRLRHYTIARLRKLLGVDLPRPRCRQCGTPLARGCSLRGCCSLECRAEYMRLYRRRLRRNARQEIRTCGNG
mgnify:CR=1 FL=1